MVQKEKTKIKFFAQRDWHILHFILTLAIGVLVGVMAILASGCYYNSLNYGRSEGLLWSQTNQRLKALEEQLKLQIIVNEDGSYSYRQRTQADEDFDNKVISAEEYNKIMEE